MSKVKRIKLEGAVCEKNHTLQPILPDDLLEKIPLVEVYVDTIVNPKDISKVIVEINSILPIPELAHLKRVRGKEVLLHYTNNTTTEDLLKKLQDQNFNINYLANNVRTVQVASIPPKVRQQYDCVNKLWPCNFHSNKYLEKLSTNTLFSSDELLNHAQLMRVAVDIAKKTRNLQQGFNKSVGAVVVDPRINSIVAVGFDRSSEGPCRHAIMTAVDNVAKTQNGGAWKHNDGTTGQKPDLNLDGIPNDLLLFLKEKHQLLQFGASWFQGKTETEVSTSSDGPYLCTGYYVYVTHEPCVMCAMALIHSRVKRLFYGSKTLNGALGSLCKIHTVKELNHHYEVFAGLLETECLQLMFNK